MKNEKTHAMLLALVGGYVLYIAWHLFDNLRSGAGDMPQAAAIAAIALFAVAGVAVLLYALHVYRTPPRKEEESETESPDHLGR